MHGMQSIEIMSTIRTCKLSKGAWVSYLLWCNWIASLASTASAWMPMLYMV